MAIWGVYDTQDNLWLGDESGPRLFRAGDKLPKGAATEEDAFMLARLAAELVDIRMLWEIGRCKAREYNETANKKHDTLEYHRTFEVALKGKEDGRFA